MTAERTVLGQEIDLVSRQTHEEFEKRMDAANLSLDKRVTSVENSLTSLHEMSQSVSELAISMRAMSEEQHEQHQDIREIRSTMQSINVEHLELKVAEHDKLLEDHDHRIRVQEQKPQDSKDHEDRLRCLEGRAGKRWEALVGAAIAGIVAFLVGMACANLFPGG